MVELQCPQHFFNYLFFMKLRIIKFYSLTHLPT